MRRSSYIEKGNKSKTLREGVLKAEGTGGREAERWHGSEVCTPEDLRSVHTCSPHQEGLDLLDLVVPWTLFQAPFTLTTRRFSQ